MKQIRYTYLALILTILLGSHKGFLALWRQGEDAPLRIYPLRIDTLPPADQELLEAGIEVESEGHLARLLEDFWS